MNHLAKSLLLLAVFVAGIPTSVLKAQEISASPTNTSGIYAPGEAIEWKVELKGAKDVSSLKYVIKKGALNAISEGTVDLKDGVGTVQAKLDEPGSLLVQFTMTVGGKAVKGLAGAVVSPEKIQPSAPAPDDFDAFWKSKLDELAAVPANSKLEPAEAKPTGQNKPPVEYFKLQLDNIRGTHIYGQLAKPKKPGKFPALLLVQYAGVYGLPAAQVVKRGEEGWLCLNIMAHDLPFDQPKEFYDKQAAGPLKNYVQIGNEDRETSYFLRMDLGCYRAAEYLTTRGDWDGKTLVVMGTSQGGYQAFVTAGLHPSVTAMLANVPAGCDVTAKEANRAAGWPYLESGAAGKDVKKVMMTARYFDAVNFARRVKCPAMITMGLIDETCPAAGVLGAANVVQGKVTRLVMPLSNHHGDHGAQNAFWSESEAWLKELAKVGKNAE